jgi:hypothetical protein
VKLTLSASGYELEYWNGTVQNVAHGMILVCMEFMLVPNADAPSHALELVFVGKFHQFFQDSMAERRLFGI